MIVLPRQIVHYGCIMSLFCLDIWAFFLFEQQIFHLLISFLIVHACYKRTKVPLVIGMFFLAIESFIMYGQFGLSLLYGLPSIVFIIFFHPYLYITLLYPAIISSLCSLVSILVCQGYLLGLPIQAPYTVSVIFANLIVTIAFSLKSKMGKTRQSLIHQMV